MTKGDHATNQSTATETRDRPNPTQKSSGQEHHRREQVLTRKVASSAKSIADAVVVKNDEPFFLCPPDGQIAIGDRHGLGLYYHDTRFVAGYEMQIGGTTPTTLAASAATGTRMTLELTNDDFHVGDHTVDKEALAIRWTRSLDGDRVELADTITFQSHDDEVTLPVRLAFAPGFDDVMAIRGLLDEQPGTCHDPKWDGADLVFRYDGKDGVIRRLTVSFDPPPTKRDAIAADIRLKVPANGEAVLKVRLRATEELMKGAVPIEHRTSKNRQPASSGIETRADTEDEWIGGDGWTTEVRTDSLVLRTVLGRSLDDLRLLRGELDGHAYYAAGIPWFSTLFGRDALISAYETLAFNADVAADTLRLLAGRQGQHVDHWRDEAPGKILHELRIGELARLDEIPQTPYYGSIDSTLLFLILLARHADWTGSLDVFRELRGNVERALNWISDYGDADGDGYVEYDSHTKRGLVNQGWKDSGNGIVDSNGKIAQPPIALCEVQGYLYAAKIGIAGLYERDGDSGRAERLRREASELRDRFERDYWSDDLGCYVLARHGEHVSERAEVVTSNAGQVLWSGLPSDEHARAVCERLFRDDMFNGWGIRTLSSDARAYWPIGYHLGTVWPHDNALIAAGLRRYGQDDAAERVFTSVIDTALQYEHQRLPECFAGYDRAAFSVPVRYPVACHPQAWAAGSVPLLLTESLGLAPDGFAGVLRVVRPRLPAFVEHLEIRGLRVGGASVDLTFERDRGTVRVHPTRVDGKLDVQVEAPRH